MESEKSTPEKKIKLVISDLRLGRGRLLSDGRINLFEEFNYDNKLIEFIKYYSAGAFKNYDVELVINGDFLNFLQVDYNGHYLTAITESVALEVLKSIISGHEEIFNALGDFLSHPFRKVTYIIGNHDQPMMFQACRNYLDEVIGYPIQYKNIVYRVDGIHMEHGHMYEKVNRINPRKMFIKQGLIEPILNLPLGSQFFIECVLKIKRRYPLIGRIRPFSSMIRWSLFNKPRLFFYMVQQLCLYFYNIMFTEKKQISFVKVFTALVGSLFGPDLSQFAKKVLSDERISSVVFGHTHVCEYKNWGANKEYFNTGTWTEFVSLDVTSLGKRTKLTYVIFEYSELDQEPRGRLKEWKGFHRIEEDVVVA